MSTSPLYTVRHARLIAVLLLALGAGSVAAACPTVDERALQWLDKMSHSLRETSYEGVVTLRRGNDMQVMQISHSVDDRGSSESLTELTGPGAQVKRLSHPLDCIHPGARLLRSPEEGHCGVAGHYHFDVSEGERVAGRKAVRLQVRPRDIYRFGYILTLDKETGLLLKSRTINHSRKTLEVMQFAHVSYTDPVPAASTVEVVHEARHPVPGQVDSRHAVSQAWSVGWVPRGFTPTDDAVGTSGRRTYTDGLAVFSVFLEDLNEEIRPGEGLVKQGGTMTYTRGMHLSGRPVLVTVLGEVPLNTARMVADSVRWVH